MCGRYAYYDSKEIIESLGLQPSSAVQQAMQFADNYNVAPGAEMPVVIHGEQNKELVFMSWGLLPAWSKPGELKLKLINARREGLLDKPMWKRLVKSHRCIVPARGFYEWKKTDDQKLPYYITPNLGVAMSFAGLWDEWTDERGEKVRTYTIITTNPNKEMAGIHNRMPAILNKQQEDIWLTADTMDRVLMDDLLGPSPDGSLQMSRVSTAVNSIRNNGKSLIYPLEDDDMTINSL